MLNTALSDEERISASKALWMLLFDEDNKKILKDTEDGIKQIQAYSVSFAFSFIVFQKKAIQI